MSPQGVSPALLDALPTHAYKLPTGKTDAERSQECTQCMVCLDDYGDGDEVRTLPCMHFFHKREFRGHPAVSVASGWDILVVTVVMELFVQRALLSA